VGRVALVKAPNPSLPKAYNERAALAEPDRAVPVTCPSTWLPTFIRRDTSDAD
jgi:hypothetical protein